MKKSIIMAVYMLSIFMLHMNVSGAPEELNTEVQSYNISNFPEIYQMPELPTGCEITALTMVLQYKGYDIDKVEMARHYLPKCDSSETYIGKDGRIYGNDMNHFFIGNPETTNGLICGTEAIVTAANTYLSEIDAEIRARDRSGISLEELYKFVEDDTPVVVWITIGLQDREVVDGWYTKEGDYIDWGRNDHGAVLIGYSPETVTIADPISGIVEYGKKEFEVVFSLRGNKCVILE